MKTVMTLPSTDWKWGRRAEASRLMSATGPRCESLSLHASYFSTRLWRGSLRSWFFTLRLVSISSLGRLAYS